MDFRFQRFRGYENTTSMILTDDGGIKAYEGMPDDDMRISGVYAYWKIPRRRDEKHILQNPAHHAR